MRRAVLGLLLAALTCAACGSPDGPSAGSSGGGPAPGTDAGRASAATAGTVCSARAGGLEVRLPTTFPADFPFPPGTVVTAVQDRGAAGVVVTGVTGRPFATVLAALQADLPAHGFTAADGESEPHDAESDWSSAAFTGRWAVRELPSCPGDTSVQVVARAR